MDRLSPMETFVAVVEAGSFSGAARRLELGQPAVSKIIAQLEQRLGTRLLLRSPRGLTPTDAGLRFYEHARRAIDCVDEAEQAVRDASQSLSGRLRVSSTVTFSRIHLLPALKTFLARHPQLELDLALEDRVIDLMATGTDVALRMGKLDDSDMIARKIAESPRYALCTPAYLEAAGIPMVPGDLQKHEAIIYSTGGSGGDTWVFRRDPSVSRDSSVTVTLGGRVRVSAAEGLRTAVLADMGIAVASEWMFTAELASGEVRRVLTDWQLPAIDLWAVFPAGRMVTSKARAFVAFVEETLAAQSPRQFPDAEPNAGASANSDVN